MKLKKVMQYRRKDAARQGLKIKKWFPTYGSMTDADGHQHGRQDQVGLFPSVGGLR
jgi:hypothetical protein